jgi:hypothetical protein
MWYWVLQTGHFFFLLGDTFGDVVFGIGDGESKQQEGRAVKGTGYRWRVIRVA